MGMDVISGCGTPSLPTIAKPRSVHEVLKEATVRECKG